MCVWFTSLERVSVQFQNEKELRLVFKKKGLLKKKRFKNI